MLRAANLGHSNGMALVQELVSNKVAKPLEERPHVCILQPWVHFCGVLLGGLFKCLLRVH